MSDILETMREYAKFAETKSEREAFEAVIDEITTLRALLAPVDDDILREIAARHVAGIDGHSDDWDRYVDEAKDYIDAIRPHIEAAERERCAKIAEAFKGNDSLYCPTDAGREGYVTACREIAEEIRSGK